MNSHLKLDNLRIFKLADKKRRDSSMFECVLVPGELENQGALAVQPLTVEEDLQPPDSPPELDDDVAIKEEPPDPIVNEAPTDLSRLPINVEPPDDITATLIEHQTSWQMQVSSVVSVPVSQENGSEGLQSADAQQAYNGDNFSDTNCDSFYCEVCFQQYPTAAELERHLLATHFKDQPRVRLQRLSCRKCKATFSNRRTLHKHIASHRSVVQCPECDKSFKNQASLGSHMRIHKRTLKQPPKPSGPNLEMTCLNEGEIPKLKFKLKKYVCKVCQLKLTSKTKMLNHLFTEHCDEQSASESEPEFNCNICDFQAKSSTLLDEHIATHPKCKLCDVTFATLELLKEHEVVHERTKVEPLVEIVEPTEDAEDSNSTADFNNEDGGDQNFDDSEEDVKPKEEEEEENDDDFPANLSVKPSKITAPDVRNVISLWERANSDIFACNFCLLNYPSKHALYKHAETYHTDKNAPQKPRAFSKHVSIGPFKCDLCPSSFTTMCSLVDHKLRHRCIVPYICKFCTKMYMSRKNLANHCYKQHPTELEVALLDSEQPRAEGETPLKKLNNPSYIEPTEEDKISKRRILLVCSLCKIRFKSLFQLYKHSVQKHMDKTRIVKVKNLRSKGPYSCSMCKFRFEKLSVMRLHMLRHFHLKPYMCKHCGQLNARRRFTHLHMMEEHTSEYATQYRKVTSQRTARNIEQATEKWRRKTFTCDECNIVFKKLKDLRTHIADVHLRDLVTRSLPSKSSRDDKSEEFEAQFREDFYPDRRVQYEPHTCFQCGMKYFRKHLLVYHMKEQHGTEYNVKSFAYHCRKCKKYYNKRYELREHEMIVHLGIKPYRCKLCVNVSFRNRGSLYLHRKNHHPKEFANRRKSTRSTTKSAAASETEKDSEPVAILEAPSDAAAVSKPPECYRCNECEQVFKKKEAVTDHIKVHLNLPFKCNLCPTKFKTPKKLRLHFCNTKKYPFFCTVCGKRFKTKTELLIHRSKHRKTIICETCGKGFINAACLIRHTACYHEAPKFLCPECGAMFSLQNQLDRHLKNHKEMKHVCVDCPRKFWDIRQLQQHRNMEHKEKRFICELCGRALSQKWHYESHMSRHNGERKYGCEDCGKSYTSINALKYHNRTRHPERLKKKTDQPVKRNRNKNIPTPALNVPLPECPQVFPPDLHNNFMLFNQPNMYPFNNPQFSINYNNTYNYQ
ncbi:hypothetical protein B566_EDAN013106 [Ephemera danica]|nr:hypothetical protein B566_EDAN013106 [Ephemera danica]